jgi:SAM-dependent methyltransferase
MASMNPAPESESYRRECLKEYSADESVQKYVTGKAGCGITYLLHHTYGRIYEEQIDQLVKDRGEKALRILEYGCGGGMNLIWIVKRLLDRKINLDFACGTDFSPKMIEAAKKETSSGLPSPASGKVSFHAVANESLGRDLPNVLGRPLADLQNSFDLIVGVNTFRYCFRLGLQVDAANDIFSLLQPGGRTVMIDMNSSFPFFRSKLRNLLTKPQNQPSLPSLEQYASVFREAGLQIETNRNFCWVPHSAGPVMVATLGTLSPVLQTLFPRFAMRSLVIARKPLLTG